MLWHLFLPTTLAFSILLDGFTTARGATVDFLVENGEKIHRIDRKFIAQTGDEVAMEAYYKDIDIRNSATNVTWYKQNEKIKFGGRFKLSNNNTVLTIKNLYLEDKGSYESVIMATNSSTFVTEFKLIIHNGPIPRWAVALIIIGLVFLLAGTMIFFKCRREISGIFSKQIPTMRERSCTAETSFHE